MTTTKDLTQTPPRAIPRARRFKPSVIRDTVTGYLFISPALFLIFIFGIFPIGYAFYMSLHRWKIQKTTFFCDPEGAYANFGDLVNHFSSDVTGVLRSCLQHYEVSAIGSWNGLLVTFLGFTTMFVLYMFWVNVFNPNKDRSTRSLIIWQVGLLVLAVSLVIAAMNGAWNAPTLIFLGAVIVMGSFWFWTNQAGHEDQEPVGQSKLIQQVLFGLTALIGVGVLVWAVLSVGTIVASLGAILQDFSWNTLLTLYLGLILMLGFYLLSVQDNDELRELPVTKRIDRVVYYTIRAAGIFLLACLLIGVGVPFAITLFGEVDWIKASIGVVILQVILAGLGVLMSYFVLGDELGEKLPVRGYVFALLALFGLTALSIPINIGGWHFHLAFSDTSSLTMLRAAGAPIDELFSGLIWSNISMFFLGVMLLLLAYRFWTDSMKPDSRRSLARFMIALALLALSFAVISYGWNEMNGALRRRDQDFLRGLEITVFYAFGSIPLQLLLGLLLAYVLFQNIQGKEWYRMIFFLPYVTPTVASAVVFGRIFNGGESSLANSFLDSIGVPLQRWVNEPSPFMNVVFGFDLDGFLAGPSMALVTVVILGVWTYVGYNAVIFLAGLGGIPADLYEAAKVDGASQWHLFRFITLPLLSPITFYLSILGFIGTFQAFNTLFVIRTPAAQRTLDTAGLVIFDTFRMEQNYGEAAAQAIVLFLVILILTQLQRSVLEKRVFYG